MYWLRRKKININVLAKKKEEIEEGEEKNKIIIGIPLITSIIIIIFGRYIGRYGTKWISNISISIIIMKIIEIWERSIRENIKIYIKYKSYINIPNTETNIEINIENKTIQMIWLISIITMIVIKYSEWYMKKDPYIIRYIATIYIFMYAMNLLVLSNNLLILYSAWEYVGIISFILISHWYTKIDAIKSSIKAIYYNKIGDISIFIVLSCILTDLSIYNNYNITTIIIIAALTKSAQIIFHGWLGTAMNAPTPISALLHAATMVTAGVLILIKINESYNKWLYLISIITAITSALISLNTYDIKRIIAYSTCSQLSFMFIAISNNNNESSFYHLFNHAFFKAFLFIYYISTYNKVEIFKYYPDISYIPTIYKILDL